MWFVTRRRHVRELAAAKAETGRQRLRAEAAEERAGVAVRNREQVLGQNAALDADNRRLAGRVEELGKRVSALTESDPEYLADLEQQLAAEKKRADRLQARLDDAVGMPAGGPIADSGPWQPGWNQPKPRGVAP
ncbi:hypothetical protein ACFZA9_12115 [Streptomyces olivaceus]|uniref:hypothetical protein n=1 Tax=Streptomyces olivaceus TaxID=47716 RepID=UPI0036EC1B2B